MGSYEDEAATELVKVLLPPSLLRDVDALARYERRPRSEYVRLVLADHARDARAQLPDSGPAKDVRSIARARSQRPLFGGPEPNPA